MDDGINMGLLIGILSGMLPEVDPSDIESYVNAWLTAHPEATTTVQDGSITLAKLASDLAAKINSISSLSDEIGDLKSAVITYSENILKDANKWINGSVNTSNGIQFSSSTRILSYIFTNIVSYTADDGYSCRVFGYDKNMNYLGIWKGTEFRTNAGDSQFTSLSFDNLYDSGALYFRIVILKTNGAAISPSECNNVEFVFEKYAERQLYIREPFTLGNSYLLDGMNVKYGDSNKYFYYDIGDTFYFRTQFTFPKDIHSQTHNYPLFSISGLVDVSFDKAVTSQNSVQPIEPVPVYNAGFRISGIPGENADVVLHPDGWRKELLLGADAMTFRFAGDCSNTENQDIRLSVDADYVSVYHSTNNSIIHKFTKASYLTMRDLYDAITTEIESGDLTEFEAEWLNVDNLTPDDIIECDIALVGEYPTGNENSPTRYDAFPFYFTTKQGNGKKYNIEVLLNKNAEQLNYIILINGYAVYQRANIFPLFNKKVKITLYDDSENGIKLHEVECGIEPKSIYPSIANIFIEGIDIGLDKSSQGIRSSSKRVFGVSEYMKNIGREYVTMNDIQRIFDGGIATKSNYLWVMHIDDARHDHLNFATDSKLRGELIAHGVYPSAAFMINGGELSSAEKVCVTATSAIGFDYHIHTAYTDGTVNMNYYSYDQLNNNVTEAIEKFIEYFGAVPIAWGIHAGSLEYRISRYLKNKGFRFIFGGVSETDNALNEITRFGCKRTSALDSVAYSTYNRLKESY